MVLASKADGVLQVVKAGETRRDMVVRGKEVLERVGGHVLGPVLNQVKLSDLGYYYYYYYYGGYYHHETPEKEGRGAIVDRLLRRGRDDHRPPTADQGKDADSGRR